MFVIKQLENIINKITPIKDINPNIVYSNSVNKLLPDEPPKTIYVAWNNIGVWSNVSIKLPKIQYSNLIFFELFIFYPHFLYSK